MSSKIELRCPIQNCSETFDDKVNLIDHIFSEHIELREKELGSEDIDAIASSKYKISTGERNYEFRVGGHKIHSKDSAKIMKEVLELRHEVRELKEGSYMEYDKLCKDIDQIIERYKSAKEEYTKYGSAGGPMAIGEMCEELEDLKEKYGE